MTIPDEVNASVVSPAAGKLVSAEPSPSNDVAVRIPVTIAPSFVVSILLELSKRSFTAPSDSNSAIVSPFVTFLTLRVLASSLNSPVPASLMKELDPS